jgi:dihydroorotase
MHFLHLSAAGSVELVRRAKADGLPVTAEAAPHHLLLTDADVAGYDPVFKVNPPLRSPSDTVAVQRGLCDGTIDAVATDHAPHAPEAKDLPFDQAPPGMLGLETALAVAFTVLHGEQQEGSTSDAPNPSGPWRLSHQRIFGLLSWQPAAIAGLGPAGRRTGGHSAHGGPIEPGADANLCVFDPTAEWTVDAAKVASRSRNTPYAGRTFTGRVRHTVLRGEPVVVDAEAVR